jgi:sugar phosphate isomerase/epimerase
MPDPDSIRVMAAIDGLSRPMRDLANEFGHNVVVGMIDDGHKDPGKLREELEAWRARRQEEIAHTNWFEKAPAVPANAPPAFSAPAPRPSQELSLNELFPEL